MYVCIHVTALLFNVVRPDMYLYCLYGAHLSYVRTNMRMYVYFSWIQCSDFDHVHTYMHIILYIRTCVCIRALSGMYDFSVISC